MRRASLSFTLGAALLLLATPAANALGFGRSATSTTLGQPLDFFAQLASDGDEAPSRECVAAEVRIGDAKVAPESVRATIENGRNAGDLRVRVTTRTSVDEPVVTVDVTVGCGSRISRRFVAFVDPPMLRLANADADEFTPQRIDPQVAPLLDIVDAANGSRRAGAARASLRGATGAGTEKAPRGVVPGRRLAGASSVQRESASTVGVAAERKASRGELHASGTVPAARSGPHLRLDAALPVLPARAEASAAVPATEAPAPLVNPSTGSAATSPAAEPPADDARAQLAAERSRIEVLEASLARLRGQTQQQHATLVALQARLRQAESERAANGLVYLLAIAFVFAAVVAAAFWALRPRQRTRARWFETQARQQPRKSVVVAAPPPEAEPDGPRVSQPASGWNEGPQSLLPVTAPASIGGLEVTTVLAPRSHYARSAGQEDSANTALPRVHPGASSSIDELADLEQQAEFFAALGQDDAAAALLDGHLRQGAGSSPLPYLHLLAIHRRRGHRGAFERVRIEHGARFKAPTPEWDAQPEERALEDHAQAIAGLQALWATPPEAMRMIESFVVRAGANGEAFDLAGYRDLLLLYSVARDLATPEEADNGSIDLYLPLDDAPTEPWPRDAGGYAVDVSGASDVPVLEQEVRRPAWRRTG